MSVLTVKAPANATELICFSSATPAERRAAAWTGAKLTELDTGRVFRWDGSAWQETTPAAEKLTGLLEENNRLLASILTRLLEIN